MVGPLPAGTQVHRHHKRNKLLKRRVTVVTQSTHRAASPGWSSQTHTCRTACNRPYTPHANNAQADTGRKVRSPLGTSASLETAKADPTAVSEGETPYRVGCGVRGDSPLDALIWRRRPTRSSPIGVLWENVNGRNRAETAL